MFALCSFGVPGRERALVELDVFEVSECVGVGFDDRMIRWRVILEFCVDLRRIMPERQISLFRGSEVVGKLLRYQVQSRCSI